MPKPRLITSENLELLYDEIRNAQNKTLPEQISAWQSIAIAQLKFVQIPACNLHAALSLIHEFYCSIAANGTNENILNDYINVLQNTIIEPQQKDFKKMYLAIFIYRQMGEAYYLFHKSTECIKYFNLALKCSVPSENPSNDAQILDSYNWLEGCCSKLYQTHCKLGNNSRAAYYAELSLNYLVQGFSSKDNKISYCSIGEKYAFLKEYFSYETMERGFFLFAANLFLPLGDCGESLPEKLLAYAEIWSEHLPLASRILQFMLLARQSCLDEDFRDCAFKTYLANPDNLTKYDTITTRLVAKVAELKQSDSRGKNNVKARYFAEPILPVAKNPRRLNYESENISSFALNKSR